MLTHLLDSHHWIGLVALQIVIVMKDPSYSTAIQFLHQSTGRLPVPGCTNTHGWQVKSKPSTSLIHVAWESKLHSVVRSFMHPWQGDYLVIGRTVVCYAWAAQAFGAEESVGTVYEEHLGIILNPLTSRAARRGLTILEVFNLQTHFLKNIEGEMLITSQKRTLLQIFCECLLYSKDIFKSMRIADDTF